MRERPTAAQLFRGRAIRTLVERLDRRAEVHLDEAALHPLRHDDVDLEAAVPLLGSRRVYRPPCSRRRRWQRDRRQAPRRRTRTSWRASAHERRRRGGGGPPAAMDKEDANNSCRHVQARNSKMPELLLHVAVQADFARGAPRRVPRLRRRAGGGHTGGACVRRVRPRAGGACAAAAAGREGARGPAARVAGGEPARAGGVPEAEHGAARAEAGGGPCQRRLRASRAGAVGALGLAAARWAARAGAPAESAVATRRRDAEAQGGAATEALRASRRGGAPRPADRRGAGPPRGLGEAGEFVGGARAGRPRSRAPALAVPRLARGGDRGRAGGARAALALRRGAARGARARAGRAASVRQESDVARRGRRRCVGGGVLPRRSRGGVAGVLSRSPLRPRAHLARREGPALVLLGLALAAAFTERQPVRQPASPEFALAVPVAIAHASALEFL